MKVKLLIAFVWLVSLNVSAQTNFRFADSTAQWNVFHTVHSFLMPVYTETEEYRSCGDTLVQGINYQKICGPGNRLPLLARQDSLSRCFVREYSSPTEIKIYDFGKGVGDTIYSSEYGFGIVDSIDSVFIGKWRKKMVIAYTYFMGSGSDPFPLKPIWVQGIGVINYGNFLNPSGDLFCEGCDTYSLLCYFENSNRLYHAGFTEDTTCNFYESYIGIHEAGKASRVSISPNPVSDAVSIELDMTSSDKTNFQLFDLTGRLILQKRLTEKVNRLELSDVAKGMYLYNIVSGKERIDTGKLVVD